MPKRCPKCEETKSLRYFHKRSNGTPQSYCKTCQRGYGRKHYTSNKSDYNARRYGHQKRQRERIRQLLDQVKSVPCIDCEETHPPWAMDFDHRDPSTKCFDLSVAASAGYSLAKTQAEIDKCDVVCALCHRYRTFGENRSGE